MLLCAEVRTRSSSSDKRAWSSSTLGRLVLGTGGGGLVEVEAAGGVMARTVEDFLRKRRGTRLGLRLPNELQARRGVSN